MAATCCSKWYRVHPVEIKLSLISSSVFSQEQRSIQTCCQSWFAPALTTSATRDFARGTSHHHWAMRATGWFTGAMERRVSSICSSWLIRWDWPLLCAVWFTSCSTRTSVWTDRPHKQHWHLVAVHCMSSISCLYLLKCVVCWHFQEVNESNTHINWSLRNLNAVIHRRLVSSFLGGWCTAILTVSFPSFMQRLHTENKVQGETRLLITVSTYNKQNTQQIRCLLSQEEHFRSACSARTQLPV